MQEEGEEDEFDTRPALAEGGEERGMAVDVVEVSMTAVSTGLGESVETFAANCLDDSGGFVVCGGNMTWGGCVGRTLRPVELR